MVAQAGLCLKCYPVTCPSDIPLIFQGRILSDFYSLAFPEAHFSWHALVQASPLAVVTWSYSSCGLLYLSAFSNFFEDSIFILFDVPKISTLSICYLKVLNKYLLNGQMI